VVCFARAEEKERISPLRRGISDCFSLLDIQVEPVQMTSVYEFSVLTLYNF
jgi:hypothetical protein